MAWVRAVLAAWNVVTAALRAESGITRHEQRTMRFGELLQHIEWLYSTSETVQQLIDEAITEAR